MNNQVPHLNVSPIMKKHTKNHNAHFEYILHWSRMSEISKVLGRVRDISSFIQALWASVEDTCFLDATIP